MVTHRLFASHMYFTSQLNVLASHSFFLLANSTCWPITLQPDGSHRLLSLTLPHAREVLLEVLTIDSNRKLDTVQFLEHVRIYGQDAVLPWEITAGSRRVEFQNDLSAEQYAALMNDNVEDLTELRLWSLEKINENKAKVARAYNKKVKPKNF